MTSKAPYDEVRPTSDTSTSSDPIVGPATAGLGDYLINSGLLRDADAFHRIRRDAVAIVKNCRRFSAGDGTKTGLVVGYVQSGKTLSMTTVSALACDNGCRLIIVLAGVTKNLLQQNATRFRNDLRKAAGRSATWRIYNSQEWPADPDQQLQRAVEEWRDPNFTAPVKQVFLYMVMKNHAHLDRLHALLSKVDLRGVPALIFDDEADQAGLNTSPDKPEGSTTYQRIARVRSAVPHHTYLQYTATPQAPLLISLDDMLSPAFADLVEPGDGYTGGRTFFGSESPPWIVRSIPDEDLFKPGTPPSEPPKSLLEAMRVFFVGCAIASTRGKPSRRSMLVHPSGRQNDHHYYRSWIQDIAKRWATAFRSNDPEERRDNLEEFRPAFDDLNRSDGQLPSLESLAQALQVSLIRVAVKEVNSEDGSEVDWDNADEHILVGGEKLNRGFTVEGLTVTYMPRDAGEWNADTIQQRARFFGYKAHYLSLCRLYLHPDVIGAYRAYVRHEDDVRSQLAEHLGLPLRDWRRAFFLDAKLRPTRRSVLSVPYYRIRTDRPWFVQEQPHIDLEAATRNAALIKKVEAQTTFGPDDDFFQHKVGEASLQEVFQNFLLAFETRGDDVPDWYGQLVTIRDVLESDPDARVLLVKMDSPRTRSDDGGSIKLHQGRSSGKGENPYPGDAKMCDQKFVTVQIHSLQIDTIATPVPALAVHIPKDLRRDDVIAQGT